MKTAMNTSNGRKLLPSTLFYVKTFESKATYSFDNVGGGAELVKSEDTLEKQIEDWVNETGSLIVSTSQLSVVRIAGEPQPLGETQPQFEEVRTLVVTYAPAIRKESVTYGQESNALVEVAQSADAASEKPPVEESGGDTDKDPAEDNRSETGDGSPIRVPKIPG